MKHQLHKFLLGLIFLQVIGCTKTETAAPDKGSQLASIGVNVPKLEDLKKVYGATCEKLNFKRSHPAVVEAVKGLPDAFDRCAIALKLLTTFRLNTTPSECTTGAGTTITNKTEAAANKINEKLLKGCNYSVLVELGPGTVYLMSNASTAQKNLPAAKLETDPVQLTVNMVPTTEGLDVGFPKLEVATPSDASSDAFLMPPTWNGTEFQGDKNWNLKAQ